MLIAPSEMIFNIADLHRPQLTIQIIDSTRDSIIGQGLAIYRWTEGL